MNTLQTLLTLVVLIFVLSVIVQAVQEVLKSLLNTKTKTMAQTALRLGAFMLLALLVVQCQTKNPTSPADGKKAADKEAADKKIADAAALGTPQAPGDATTTEKPLHVLVVAVARDQLSLDVTTAASLACEVNAACNVMHLIVADNVVKDQLKQFHKGDHIQVVYSTDANKQHVLKASCVDAVSPGWLSRAWVLLVSAGVCFLLYAIFSGFKPSRLIIGEDNRYSNSKFQIAVWFFVLITTYIATLWLRVWWAGWDFIGGVDIPKNLLLISGMSALTFGGAKGITASKTAAPGAAGQKAPSGDAPNFFRDLTHNDGILAVPGQIAVAAKAAVGGQPAVAAKRAVPAQYTVPPQFDFGDFQMLIITLIAVVTYIVLIFNFFGTVEYSKVVSLPDVDTTILAAFGLGHGAYLTKKAVGNVGTS